MPQKTYQDLEEESRDPFEVIDREYHKAGRKTAICLLICACGLEVVGHAQCVDAEDFEYEIGSECAREKAERKLEEYKGVMSHV